MSPPVISTPGQSLSSPYPAPAVAWYATIVLAVLYWVSILDRFIISLLVDPIKRDLGITDVQFSLLHGLGFALTFAIFGFVLGILADRLARRWVIYAGVTVWSLATAACGLAQQFWHLLLARVGVGIGEATLQPCAASMIADLFPREKLTSAMAVYAMGSTVGAGCAFFFGGMIIDWVSHTSAIVLPVIGELRSWQAVFMIIGLPGMLLAFLIFTVPEPVRRGLRAGQEVSKRSWRSAYSDLFKFIGTRRRFFTCHYLAFTLASAVLSGTGVWYPAHMGRTFHWSGSQIGLALGIVLTLSGFIAQSMCGRMVDSMVRRGVRDAQFRYYAICLLLATPIGIIATTSANPWVFVVGIGLYLVLFSSLSACAATALNLVTPNELRGTGMAFYAGTGGLIGISCGPILIALASEKLFGGAGSLGYGMALVIGIGLPLAALLLALGFRAMREAVAEAETWAN
jgi:MFS family permease